jgi:DNA recombination protein RmuC
MALEPIRIGSFTLDPVLVLLALAALAVIALMALAITLMVHMSRRRREVQAQATELAELKGRLQTFAEISVARQGDIARAVNERLDRMTHRVGSDLNETARKTSDSIAKLNERLAVIDTAQKNLTDLSTNMVSLQEILANKQARGAFGQMRMETIVKDGLPKGAYSFQPTLSNGKRPDCLLHMPNASAGVVIDAKFPLEGFEAFRTARREEEKKEAARRVRVDVGRHVDSMAERYFISGETQDTAILFVPSEAIYADLCEHFSDVVQKAHRARIVICAPNMLMLAVQTMQAILKDVKMREQAHLIQREVAKLMDDMGRFRERVLDLQRHFGQANADIEKILTSSDRIASRGRKIETLDFEEAPPAAEIEHSNGAPSPGSPGGEPSPDQVRGKLSPPRGEEIEPRRNGGARDVRQPDLLAGE